MLFVTLRQKLFIFKFASAVTSFCVFKPLTFFAGRKSAFSCNIKIFLLKCLFTLLLSIFLLSVSKILVKLSLIDLTSGWDETNCSPWTRSTNIGRLWSGPTHFTWFCNKCWLYRSVLPSTSSWTKFLISDLHWLFAHRLLVLDVATEWVFCFRVVLLRAKSHLFPHFVP